MNNHSVAAVVLAAGRGTRLKARTENQNKVTLSLAGKPMITYTVATLDQLQVGQKILVVGHHKDSVMSLFSQSLGIHFAEQPQPLGTGHAVECALPALKPSMEYVLVLYGDDSAFFPASVLQQVIDLVQSRPYAFTFLSMRKQDPKALGRVVRDDQQRVKAIVEEKNASDEQKKITEVNLGGFCFNRDFLISNIGKIEFNPVSQERYLTDMVDIALRQDRMVEALCLESEGVWHGVNTEDDLQLADEKMKERL